nr:nucleotide-binding alpha-beta plait domain-containing protein [Tanacetum cinerariifolium]
MGIDDWKDVTGRKHRRSKDDEVLKISKLVFVTNFPESIYAHDLWKSCSVYGTVVDVFIPSKKSKAVRFERPHKPNVSATNNSGAASRTEKPFNSQQTNNGVGSYANIVNGISTGMQTLVISSSPALVLEDSCLIDRDLSNHVLGKVKEFLSIANLHTIIKDEGFLDVKVSYIGGLWVLLELTLMDIKLNLMNHIGVKSWFHTIQEACDDFVSDERIVWSSDVESVHASINNELNRPPNGEEPDDEFMNNEDGVPETIFGSSSSVPNHRDEDKNAAYSDDPFGLYDLLKNKK